MEIIHHFGIKLNCERDRREFAEAGIVLGPGVHAPSGAIVTSLDIGEHDPKWRAASRIAAKFRISESVFTKFNQAELDGSSALCILASSQRGYPAPSENLEYLDATFDLSECCAKCGIGRRQVRPFRLTSVPSMQRTILQINWIFDEYFVTRDIWTAIFEPLGIAAWPVVLDRTGEEIQSVVQLKISQRAALDLDEADADRCSMCNRTIARLDLRGFCPEPRVIPAPIFKSTQFFGSGGNAINRVLISSSLYRQIRNSRLRGVTYYPCGPK